MFIAWRAFLLSSSLLLEYSAPMERFYFVGGVGYKHFAALRRSKI